MANVTSKALVPLAIASTGSGWSTALTGAIAGLVGLVTAAWAEPPANEPPITGGVLIYYANETQRDAIDSPNYRRLLAALGASGSAKAKRIIDNLRIDAEVFPTIVENETAAILRRAIALGFHARVFTNALAIRGQYLRFDPGVDHWQFATLPPLPPSSDSVLIGAPLSRPEGLRAALAQVGADAALPRGDLVLVTKSHGDDEMALLPRVFADLSTVSRDELIRELDAPAGPAEVPAWSRPKGVTKREFWLILAEFARATPSEFALVFREACRSGVASVREYLDTPQEVRRFAHSGGRSLRYGEVDYDKLLAGLVSQRSLSEQLARGLEEQGLQITTAGGLRTSVLRRLLVAAKPAILFVPLLAWIWWYLRAVRRATSKNA